MNLIIKIAMYVSTIIFIYFFVIVISYCAIIVNAFFRLKTDMKVVNSNIDLESESLSAVSILVPAYNESETIIDSITSLTRLDYDEYEIIVVNDGSSDDTCEKVVSHFGLSKLPITYNHQLECEEIKRIYTDLNSNKITVIDKANGGKADSLNAAINISRYPYICCIDADCILEENALKKISRHFARRKETIAIGGMVKAANGCVISDGKVIEKRLPKKFIEKVQVLEYLRAFLTNRFTWNDNNSTLIISGAFGMFKKDAVIRSGGYKKGLGEDMELVVRMQEYYRDNGIKYYIGMASDAVCWTQLPSSYKDLRTQRKRWHKGLIESLWKHKQMLLNPRYGKIGMLSFPQQFFVEMCGPVIEGFGYIIFILLLLYYDLTYMVALVFIMAYLYGVFQTLFAVIFEKLTYDEYSTRKNTVSLIAVCFLEPIIYRPFTVFWRIEAFLGARRKKKGWGNIKRQKF